jgi:hypothetical protein
MCGAMPKHRNNYQYTALMYAACNTSTTYDTFRLLIEVGMSVNAKNHSGDNIMMFYMKEKVIIWSNFRN